MEGLVILVVLALAAIPVLLPIVSLVVASRTRARLQALEDANARLQEQVNALAARVQRGPTAPVVTREAAEPETGTRPGTRARSPPGPAAQASAVPAEPPGSRPRAVPPSRSPAPPPPVTPARRPCPAAPPGRSARRPTGRSAGRHRRAEPRLHPSSRPARPPRGSRVPPGRLSRPASRRAGSTGRAWSAFVSSRRWRASRSSIAAVFFLRYSIEQGWLQPPVRVAIGVLTGLSLLVVCERKAARRYPVTANALDAAAVSILFATFFAAHALWNLIPALPTFLLLALVAAVAVLLSIRHESLFIAVLGLLGGFSTPALLSTGENRPIPLFALPAAPEPGPRLGGPRARLAPPHRPEPRPDHPLPVGLGLQVPRRAAGAARDRHLPRLPRGVAGGPRPRPRPQGDERQPTAPSRTRRFSEPRSRSSSPSTSPPSPATARASASSSASSSSSMRRSSRSAWPGASSSCTSRAGWERSSRSRCGSRAPTRARPGPRCSGPSPSSSFSTWWPSPSPDGWAARRTRPSPPPPSRRRSSW